MDYTKMKVGTKIYYTGDRANIDGFGKITKVESSEYYPVLYTIKMEDGRVLRSLTPVNFAPSVGRRFWPASEYEADRQTKLKAMGLA